MVGFFSIPPGSSEPSEKLFVGQFSPVKLDLNLDPVHPDVTRHIEGDGVLDPGLGSPPLGQLPLEVLALVVGGVLDEQALSSDQLSGLAQLGTVRARQLNPDFGEPAPLGACTVELEETAQLSEAQLLGVQVATAHEPEGVHVGSTAGVVGVHHLGHGHLGQPLSFTVPTLYTRRMDLSMSFL